MTGDEIAYACLGAVVALCVVAIGCWLADMALPHDDDVHCRFGYVAVGALTLALVPLGVAMAVTP